MNSPARNGGGHGQLDITDLTSHRLDALDLARGMSVEAANGRIGSIDEILYNSTTGRITHFLVRGGEGLTRDALVPVEWIAGLDHERVLLAVRVEQVEAYADRPSDRSVS